MAEKKPSKYSDRGTIGSAEELDAYGVWVKSEPQDMTAGMAEAVNFDAEAVPYADFDMEFDDPGESNFDFGGLEPEIPEISVESDDNVDFDDGITTTIERGGEEASTQLLMKIADELSAIRSELSTLKKEFAGVRIEGVPGVKAETRHGGFFDGEEGDDEKITLTGDEMENILTSADFSAEEDIGFATQREADEAALKELSAQNESAAETEEEIEIDFDNLGINLDDETETEAEAQDEFPPLEDSTDDDFETSSFDALSLEAMPPLEEIPSEEMQEELMPLEELVEDEELQNLRLEGAIPLTPAPDNSVYLETDPFAVDDFGLEDTPLEKPVPEEDILNENTVLEETVSEEIVPLDTASEITTDLSFDEAGFDLTVDDFSAESLSPLEEETGEEQADAGALDISVEGSDPFEEEISIEQTSESSDPFEEEISIEQTSESLDPFEEEISIEQTFESPVSLEDEISIEQTFESPVPLEDEISVEQTFESPVPLGEEVSDEQVFDTGSLDLSEAVIDEPDLSAGIVEAPLEEPVLGDISFGDDISLDMDDFGAGIDLDVKDSFADDPVGGPAESLAVDNLALDIDTSVELGAEENLSLTDDLVMDDVAASVELDTEDSGLIDDLADDLALDDFGAGIDLNVKEDSGLADDSVDDGLTGIIPEGFEKDAEEAPISVDDDLEAFADDLSIEEAALPGEISLPEASTSKTAEADAGGNNDIPASFRTELKSVLSYMDRLLESLPEDKIEEFAKSEYFDSYKKIFKELGLV